MPKREQSGQLQVEGEAANHLIILYPKFHCELNFIERSQVVHQRKLRELIRWLEAIVPTAVSTASINRYYGYCARAIDAYSGGFKCGTKSFTARIYKGHRQVVDKTKW